MSFWVFGTSSLTFRLGQFPLEGQDVFFCFFVYGVSRYLVKITY